MEQTLSTPVSNIQLELLKLYAHQVSDPDLLNIKQIVGEYFANRLISKADQVWETKKWDDQKIESILNEPGQ
jgi:hypothetical protein